MTSRVADGPPRRVVVLVKRFPRLSETFIMNEFLELRRKGLPVELFAIMDPREARSHPEALALVPEVSYLQTGRLPSALPAVLRTARRHPWGAVKAAAWMLTRHSSAAARNLVHAMVLVDLLACGDPAHVHAHFLHSPAAIAFIARKISGQRYSVSGHAKDIYTTLPENVRMRCRGAEFVTTCTDANRRYLLEEVGLDPSRVHVCRHGVDVSRFDRGESERRAGRVVSVGRLVPKKGFDVLVRACGELLRRGVDFELRIVGGGELRAELVALAKRERVGDRVRLLGSMSHAEVADELAACEVFALAPKVMPDGDRDGIPNVLLEAMAAGAPVVASAVSGIPELLSDGVNGRLVAPARTDLLADALTDLLTDPDQRAHLAAAGRRLVAAEWSWPRAVLPLDGLLRDVLSPPAAGRAPKLVAATSTAQ